jgi:hypothetical protein
VMPGTQTCAWLADANSRSQFGHTQRATRPIVPQKPPLLLRASAVVEFPLVAGAPWSTVNGLWRSLVAHLTGGQGVASSNLASPTKAIHPIRPSRIGIQPTFLPPSITPSDGRSGPATDHQAENAVPASSMACTSGCR